MEDQKQKRRSNVTTFTKIINALLELCSDPVVVVAEHASAIMKSLGCSRKVSKDVGR